jgi:hypothetical protein
MLYISRTLLYRKINFYSIFLILKKVWRHMRFPCCLSVCLCLSTSLCIPPNLLAFEAYEITLLSVYVLSPIFSYEA